MQYFVNISLYKCVHTYKFFIFDENIFLRVSKLQNSLYFEAFLSMHNDKTILGRMQSWRAKDRLS